MVAVRQPFAQPMTVVLCNPKGSAGKTPATLLAASTFGLTRGGYVAAWDNNETRGTLGLRAQQANHWRTVWGLLGDLDRFETAEARSGDLGAYMRPQDAQFDVLASDDDPSNMAAIGAGEFQRIENVLSRFYRIICVDTGNNVRAANWQAAVDAADQLVVCSTFGRDSAYSASWMLDHLEQTGREEIARRAVTVLSAADPGEPADADEIEAHFVARTRAVVEIPYDPHIAERGLLQYSRLARSTRNAWLYACAAIADGLALAERRTI